MAVLAIAAMAAFAPSAFAETGAPATQEAVVVLHEDTSTYCDEPSVVAGVASGTCELYALGLMVEMHAHSIFGETLAAGCDNELAGTIDGDGEGVLGASQIWFPSSSGLDPSVECWTNDADPVRPCDAEDAANLGHAGAQNWHIEVVEDHATGQEWMDVAICLKGVAVVDDVYGHLWVQMTGGNHPTGMEAEDVRLREVEGGASGVDLEFAGHWSLEDGSVELFH